LSPLRASCRLFETKKPVSPRELRDQAMVAMLIGCGLRRAESLAQRLESIQRREDHRVIADLVGRAASSISSAFGTAVEVARQSGVRLTRTLEQGYAEFLTRHSKLAGAAA
jgi:hypothetical protein